MNLLLTGAFNYSQEQRDELARLGYRLWMMQHETGELPLDESEVDAVVCNGLFLHHDIGKFTNLRLIQLTSAGLDRVPVETIRARGIVLHNARGVYSVPMAEWAVCKVLDFYKQSQFFRDNQLDGRWEKHRSLRELAGKRLAIIGAGNIGQEVARRFSSFGVHVTGFDIHTRPVPFFHEMDLTERLRRRIPEFDIVVITAPLLPETTHLLDRDMLSRLREGAVLVNISRGALIDEGALKEVAHEREDVSFALDVFEAEPLPPDDPLWTCGNVVLSPHNSFVSDGNGGRMFGVIYNNLKMFISE